ncbi:MAG: citrate transporter, partial [Pseudomonadota bacterium]
GSVVGDTTTTMMWISGVSPLSVLHAYVAAAVALVVCGIPAALQQHKYSPIMKYEPGAQVDWARVGVVAFILVAAIVTNVYVNVLHGETADSFPFIGVAVVLAILVSMPLRKPAWNVLPEATKGTIFLLSLVTCASMMPVEKLPAASWQSAMTLGFVSAVFDNIPLTALALKQGGFDWGMLAYTVGFGGSMIWFGSSAGVAISNMYPEAKNAGRWLYHGWHVTVAYVIGFFVLLAVLGWQPTPKRGDLPPTPLAPINAPAVPAR